MSTEWLTEDQIRTGADNAWRPRGIRLAVGLSFASTAFLTFCLFVVVVYAGQDGASRCEHKGFSYCGVGQAILLFWVGIPLVLVSFATTFGSILALTSRRVRWRLAAGWFGVGVLAMLGFLQIFYY